MRAEALASDGQGAALMGASAATPDALTAKAHGKRGGHVSRFGHAQSRALEDAADIAAEAVACDVCRAIVLQASERGRGLRPRQAMAP